MEIVSLQDSGTVMDMGMATILVDTEATDMEAVMGTTTMAIIIIQLIAIHGDTPGKTTGTIKVISHLPMMQIHTLKLHITNTVSETGLGTIIGVCRTATLITGINRDMNPNFQNGPILHNKVLMELSIWTTQITNKSLNLSIMALFLLLHRHKIWLKLSRTVLKKHHQLQPQ